MRILLAPDSYKGCLSAAQVCAFMRDGIRAGFPDDEVISVPLSDGGEGLVDCLQAGCGGDRYPVKVCGPCGGQVTADYLRLDRVAVIEAATACGLHLVREQVACHRNFDRSLDPLHTTTRGVGELLLAAILQGAEQVVLGLGGSGTVDGGTGLARALGYGFVAADGEALPEGGGSLSRLAKISRPDAAPWREVEIRVACDVVNPLLGEKGAAPVFAPQKGADPAEVALLASGLARLAEVIQCDLGVAVGDTIGGGAAGGLGAGLQAFCGARLESGIELVTDLLGFKQRLQGVDLILTGEGRTDAQTAGGKVCSGIARMGRDRGIPVVVLSGAVAGDPSALGATGVFSISRGPSSLEAAIENAASDVAEAALQIVSLCHGTRGLSQCIRQAARG